MSALGRALPENDGWSRSLSDLVAEAPESPIFTCGDKAAILLIAGDDMKPGQFRGTMEALSRKAKAPPTPRQTTSPLPWAAVFVLLVYERECPPDMRTFTANDRRALTPPRFLQGGWIDLDSSEANFRVQRNPFETELLQIVQKTATDWQAMNRASAAAPRRRSGRLTGGEEEAPPPSVRETVRVPKGGIRDRRRDARTDADRSRDAFPQFRDDEQEADAVAARPSGFVWATIVLAAICCGMFGVVYNAGGGPAELLRFGALQSGLVKSGGEFWRAGGSLFLHAGPIDLGVNMVGLLLLGLSLERVLGGAYVMAVFAVAGSAGVATIMATGSPTTSWCLAPVGLVGLCGALIAATLRYRGQGRSAGAVAWLGLLLLVGYNVASGLVPGLPTALAATDVGPWQYALGASFLAGLVFTFVFPTGGAAVSIVLALVGLVPVALCGWSVYNGFNTPPATSRPQPISPTGVGGAPRTVPLARPAAAASSDAVAPQAPDSGAAGGGVPQGSAPAAPPAGSAPAPGAPAASSAPAAPPSASAGSAGASK